MKPRNLEHAQLIARDRFLKQLRAEMRGVLNSPGEASIDMIESYDKRLNNWIKRISKEIDP